MKTFCFSSTLSYIGESAGHTTECECEGHCRQEELPTTFCCRYLPKVQIYHTHQRSSKKSIRCVLPNLGYGRREAVEILLNAGANVHARDDGE